MRIRTWAVAIAIWAVGCAGSPPPHAATPLDPQMRLEALLEQWRALHAPGSSCETLPSDRAPIDDCGRLRGEVGQLALAFPRNPQVLFAAAVMASEAREREQSASYLDQLFAVVAIFPQAAVLRAQLALDDGNLALARRVLREQIALAPSHAGLREAQAGVLYLAGEPDAADAELEVAFSLGAPAWRVAYHRGLLAEAAGRADRAVDFYREASEMNPGFALAHERLVALVAEGAR